MYKIAYYSPLLAFYNIYRYAMQYLSTMSAKEVFTEFSGNKYLLKRFLEYLATLKVKL